jgi:hypothetical protein
MVYKDLQKKTYPPLRVKQYTPPTLIQQSIHIQPGVSYAQITSQNPSTTPTPAPVPPANLLTPTVIQRHLGPQSPVEKPLRPNGNLAKPTHHRPYKTQIMAPFLQLALWNANGLHQHAEELKAFLSL